MFTLLQCQGLEAEALDDQLLEPMPVPSSRIQQPEAAQPAQVCLKSYSIIYFYLFYLFILFITFLSFIVFLQFIRLYPHCSTVTADSLVAKP